MITIPYGNQKIAVDYPFEQVKVIQPYHKNPAATAQEILQLCLQNTLSRSEIKEIDDLNGKTIAIAVNDQTRPLPHEIILPELIQYLKKKGAEAKNITFFISTGTHRELSQEELRGVLPDGLADEYPTFCHRCSEINALLFLGYTSIRTPVFVNKKFYQSDTKIVVGNIEPHHFMGFSGGMKTAAIGLTGRETIEKNHSLLTDPKAKLGTFLDNPMRKDVEEIGRMIGVDYALNVVLNDDKEILAAFWGDPLAVMEKGIPVSLSACQVEMKASDCRFDLVIASVGGYPKDINLYQSQKALTNACLFSSKNGVIILAAECRNGSGNIKFERFMREKLSWQQVLDEFQAQPFEVGPHKAYLIARQAVDHKIILLSSLPDQKVRDYLLTPAGTIAEAVKIAGKYLPSNPRVAVLPYATHSLPVLNEVN